MKFIRDIISEKARLSAERAAASPHPELELPQTQTAIRRPQPETDLESVDALPSSPDPSETTSVSSKQSVNPNPISWDALASDQSLDSDDERSAMNTLFEDDPELEAEPEATSDAYTSALWDALDTLDAEDDKSLFQDDVRQDSQFNADDTPVSSSEEPLIGTDPNGLEIPNRIDDIEARSTIEKSSQDALDQFLQTQESKNSPTSGAETTGPRTNSVEAKMSHTREANTLETHVVSPQSSENGVSRNWRETPVPVSSQVEQISASQIDKANTKSDLPEKVSVPAPAVGRGAARAGRVKTRLLGFNPGQSAASDPFDKRTQQNSAGHTQFPVGWLIVVDGYGEGSAFTLFDGVSQIGRGSDQTVCLDFGDNSISRENHAVVAYDSETRKFFLGHGGKTNLVRLNNRPVLSTEEIESGNTIRIGETTLRFVGLCGDDFQWQQNPREDRQNASFS